MAVEGEYLDVGAGDEEDDALSGVGASDADVVEAASVSEGDGADVVDFVVADAVAGGVDLGAGGDGFSRLFQAVMGVWRPMARWGRVWL